MGLSAVTQCPIFTGRQVTCHLSVTVTEVTIIRAWIGEI